MPRLRRLNISEQAPACEGDVCAPSGPCADVFERVTVLPLVRGGTRVRWTMSPQGGLASPLTFTLQVAEHSGDSGNWTDVITVNEALQAVDDTKRLHGRLPWTYYRVKVVDASTAVHYSKPVLAHGSLSFADSQLAREVMRREELRLRQGKAGSLGYLLQRKHAGTRCTACIDHDLSEESNPDCTTCLGTGWVGGYYTPIGCFYMDLSLDGNRLHRDPQRGSVDTGGVQVGQCLADPPVVSGDVWVEHDSDLRYYVHEVRAIAHVKNLPLVLKCELRRAPFTDVIYRLAITAQDSA